MFVFAYVCLRLGLLMNTDASLTVRICESASRGSTGAVKVELSPVGTKWRLWANYLDGAGGFPAKLGSTTDK